MPAPQDSQPSSTIDAATLPTAASSDPSAASDQIDQLAQFAQEQANATLQDDASKRGTCNIFNVAVRREWGALSQTERKSYIDAVLCLQKKQAKTPSSLIPGAKTRFDDWVGTHIKQTLTIHYTGTFLGWHRYFVWQYEQALRNECGYQGYQPYWDWSKTAVTGLENSPMLDGSDTSMSGNGEYIPGQGNVVLGASTGLPPLYIPPGTGGGCVKSGPFKDMSVNLGPAALDTTNGTSVSNGDGLGYNPRCLKRDLTDYCNQKFANASAVANLILKSKQVADFQLNMQGVPGSGSLGVHGGGHYSMGGDPGRDVFTSPGDPLFYLHHGMIDRTWWIWQQLDRTTRTGPQGVSGTNTFFNQPPSANTTLDNIIDLGYAAGPPIKLGDLMSTTDGPMCYIYL
ncbi:Di-copper centre-containing protein [Setomelanomma holmii]|uniref:Di-copper centre-containing protein n=1 Tax=Setomelanomma holmii TaxID=210430 RepID=A0A9P4H881_9PLEO|nr:Di-copper centre-containing protein [Setomelanomma holmii]